MAKKIFFFTAFISLFFILYGESRKFFCLSDGKCITVWKTYNNVCYIIPGKYYGIVRPSSHSFIQTTNNNILDIIWIENSDDLIINSDNDSNIIVKNSSQGTKFIKYNINKVYNDSSFTYIDGPYHRYKKSVNYLNIFISENYAVGKNGKKL